jgi:hypothetical protein
MSKTPRFGAFFHDNALKSGNRPDLGITGMSMLLHFRGRFIDGARGMPLESASLYVQLNRKFLWFRISSRP